MSYAVFWIESTATDFFPGFSEPRVKTFTDLQLTEALQHAEHMRKAGHRHVCLSSEDPNRVGSDGVDTIADGKTPDGHDYTWKKRRL